MAIDRIESLRRAEKLLRQGRLDAAIEEYERLIEEQPRDWNTRNVLGDLHVRAGQIERAAAQFTRIADHFAQEGFLSRAFALYKKVVKIKPDDEHALVQSAEIAVRQGLLVDAKACFAAIADRRRQRGDAQGAAETLRRIAALDPSDLAARLTAARAAAEAGEVALAATGYKDIAAELFARERVDEGIQALTEVLTLRPDDDEARDQLVRVHLARGEIDAARRHAHTTSHLRALADDLTALGREQEALDALFAVVEREPEDVGTRVRLARRLIARGEIERAAACAGADPLVGDPELALLSAEVQLRTGRAEAAREHLKAILARDRGRRDDVLTLAARLVDADPQAAFDCVDVATDAAVADCDWRDAVSALQDYVHRVPGHVPALMKLVDVCVDGGMEDPLLDAQAALADAYLDAGRAPEARVIAEDLFARMPNDPVSVERFRRALQMVGEADPDAVIAERVSAQAAAPTEDLNIELAMPDAASPGGPADALPPSSALPSGPVEPPVAPEHSVLSAPQRASVYELSPGAIDLSGILGDDALERDAHGGDAPEIDLNGALTGLRPQRAPNQPAGEGTSQSGPAPAAPRTAGDLGARDLDAVFAEFREEVLREQTVSTAAQQYKIALTYRDMGMLDDAIKALEIAVRVPKYRFLAASQLGRIYREQGRTHQAIDWFERAAETPAPGPDAGRALLYELGRALEDVGEAVRALAVYLELQADAARYRDVATRIDRLSQQHTGD